MMSGVATSVHAVVPMQLVTPEATETVDESCGDTVCDDAVKPTPTRTPTRTPRVTPTPTRKATETPKPSPSPTIAVTPSVVAHIAYLPAVANVPPLTNHTACAALVLVPPASFEQPADNAFNIYEFTAIDSAYSLAVAGYVTTGQLLVYVVVTDACDTSNTMLLSFVLETAITPSTRVAVNATPGTRVLVAVNTTGALTKVPYAISIQP